MRRMRMNDGLNVRPHFVNQQMHRHLAGRLSGAANLVSLRIDDDHVFGFDEALVAARWRAHDGAVGQTCADVPIRRSDVRLLVNEVAVPFDFLCDIHQSGQFYYTHRFE
jgi:hypothetical protein